MCSMFLPLHIFLAALQSSGSYNCPVRLLWCSLSPGYRSSAADVLFRYGTSNSLVFLILVSFESLQYIVSVAKRNYIEWLRATLIYGYKNEYLEENWV